MSNEALKLAREKKNDEFYTLYSDIEKELVYYEEFLQGKSIICPADTIESNFYKYFMNNFDRLQLTKLTITCLEGNIVTYDGKETKVSILQNGDFMEDEVLTLMRAHDIVVTNPPFSLLCKFIKLLDDNNIKYLLVGNDNCYGNIRIFPLIKENRFRTGFTKPRNFITPNGNEVRLGNIQWVTNLEIKKESDLKLTKKYSPELYLHYENYDAINVDKVVDIPVDYYGVMGVPLTYLQKHDPSKFKILGLTRTNRSGDVKYIPGFKDHGGNGVINGQLKYCRIFIQRIGD